MTQIKITKEDGSIEYGDTKLLQTNLDALFREAAAEDNKPVIELIKICYILIDNLEEEEQQ